MIDFKNNIAKIGGWLTEAEGIFLYETAKEVNRGNAVVEIGSWKGKSTTCLGKGVQDGNNAKIYAVDPHIGSSEQHKMFGKVDTYQEFLQNIKNSGVERYIEPIRKTSEEASKTFHEPIGFLFIDGAHEYKFVNLDYKLWFPKVVDQGIIAFHDTWHFPGPHLVTAGILLFSSKIQNPKLIDTITCLTKVKKNSFFDRTYNIAFFFYRLAFGLCGFLKLKHRGSVLK
ncbi:MAG: class I SAM-dependent methyltransferase [Candidatus Moraniibacteriota bacterium]